MQTFAFAEMTYGNVGQRIFNIIANGAPELTDFDILQAAGEGRSLAISMFTYTLVLHTLLWVGHITLWYSDQRQHVCARLPF